MHVSMIYKSTNPQYPHVLIIAGVTGVKINRGWNDPVYEIMYGGVKYVICLFIK